MVPLTSEDVEKEVFSAVPAFSDRWVKFHGLPEKVTRVTRQPVGGVVKRVVTEFSSSEVFSVLLRTGEDDPISRRRLEYLSEAYGQVATPLQFERFKEAIDNGFIPLIRLKDGLKSGRIDELVEALKKGPTAGGIAKWLLYDQETRRCLTLLLRLEGYKVADEALRNGGFITDRIDTHLDSKGKLQSVQFGKTDHAFSDFLGITDDEIKKYIKAVAGVVGTDPGVAELAYTIFRILGHPHQNGKFSTELIQKYTGTLSPDEERTASPFMRKFNAIIKTSVQARCGTDEASSEDLDPMEVAPFLVKFKIDYDGSGTPITLEKILEMDGVLGLVRALNGLAATKVVREWNDMQLLLDMMDAVSDIRTGQGKYAGLSLAKRHSQILGLQELGLARAKRKLYDATVQRIIDSKKISSINEERMGLLEAESLALRKIISDLTGSSRRR